MTVSSLLFWNSIFCGIKKQAFLLWLNLQTVLWKTSSGKPLRSAQRMRIGGMLTTSETSLWVVSDDIKKLAFSTSSYTLPPNAHSLKTWEIPPLSLVPMLAPSHFPWFPVQLLSQLLLLHPRVSLRTGCWGC